MKKQTYFFSRMFSNLPMRCRSHIAVRFMWGAALIAISGVSTKTIAQTTLGNGTSMGSSIAGAETSAEAFGRGGRAAAFNSNATSQRGLSIAPRLEVGVTYTDNVSYSQGDKRADFIVETSPGIRITNDAGRLRGFIDYTLRRSQYLRGGLPNKTQNDLNSAITYEILPSNVYIDLGAQRSRNVISVLGVQPSDTLRETGNTTEISNYFISPYVHGSVLNSAKYEIRYRKDIIRSGQKIDDANIDEWSAVVRQTKTRAKTSIDLSALSSHVNYIQIRNYQAYRFEGILNYFLDPQFVVFGLLGQEWNDYLSESNQSYKNFGYGFKWRPSERVLLEARQSRRFFGNGHRVVAERRTARTLLKFSDIKDVTLAVGLGGPEASGSLFDSLFAQFASIEPDENKRRDLVNSYLRKNGLNGLSPNQVIQINSPTLRREQELTFSLFGPRRSFTLLAGQSESSRLGGLLPAAGDLGLASKISQRRIGVSLSQSLTQTSSLRLSMVVQKIIANESALGSKMRMFSLRYDNQLGSKTYLSAGLTKAIFNGEPISYTESTVFGQFLIRF